MKELKFHAFATYEDGSEINKYFYVTEDQNLSEKQYELEEWLVTRKDGCTFYSVEFIC